MKLIPTLEEVLTQALNKPTCTNCKYNGNCYQQECYTQIQTTCEDYEREDTRQ